MLRLSLLLPLLIACAESPAPAPELIDVGKGDTFSTNIVIVEDELLDVDLRCENAQGCFVSLAFSYTAEAEIAGSANLIADDVFYSILFSDDPNGNPELYPGPMYRIDPARNAGAEKTVVLRPPGVMDAGTYLLSLRKAPELDSLELEIFVDSSPACSLDEDCNGGVCSYGTCSIACEVGGCPGGAVCVDDVCVADSFCEDGYQCGVAHSCVDDLCQPG